MRVNGASLNDSIRQARRYGGTAKNTRRLQCIFLIIFSPLSAVPLWPPYRRGCLSYMLFHDKYSPTKPSSIPVHLQNLHAQVLSSRIQDLLVGLRMFLGNQTDQTTLSGRS